MRVLVVEDEEPVLEDLKASIPADITVTDARSRDSAIALVRNEEYDLIVCDLRLPPVEGDLGLSEQHGFAVHAECAVETPGTPAIIFTGYATPANIREALSAGATVDLFGTGDDFHMVQLRFKHEMLACANDIRRFAEHGLRACCKAVEVHRHRPRSCTRLHDWGGPRSDSLSLGSGTVGPAAPAKGPHRPADGPVRPLGAPSVPSRPGRACAAFSSGLAAARHRAGPGSVRIASHYTPRAPASCGPPWAGWG